MQILLKQMFLMIDSTSKKKYYHSKLEELLMCFSVDSITIL